MRMRRKAAAATSQKRCLCGKGLRQLQYVRIQQRKLRWRFERYVWYVWNRLYKIYILYSKLVVFVLEAAYLSNRLLPPKIDGQTLNGYDSSLPGEISCILTLAPNSLFALVFSNGECTMAEIERYQLSNPNINIDIVSFITTLQYSGMLYDC